MLFLLTPVDNGEAFEIEEIRNEGYNVDKTVLIVIAAVAIVQAANYLLFDRSKRKMVCYTTLTLLNDLAFLSERAGYKSWIDYLQATYGEDKAAIFLTQLYATLTKNKIRDERLEEARGKLKEYLTTLARKEQKS